MYRSRLHRIFCLNLALALLSIAAKAEIPQFSARTLDGETITDGSLRGRVVLLQFWTTWCPYCHRDQSVLDELERRFADKGLMVLAVNVGEPEQLVRAYQSSSPRSCRVLLNPSADIASKFGAHGFPYYVLLDAQGRVLGTQSGSGGEASLLQLLRRAGLSSRTESQRAEYRAENSSDASKPLMIVVPSAQSTVPPKPRPKTVFILTNGERLESEQYTIDSRSLRITLDGKQRTIALSALNMNATKAANRERGIAFAVPETHGEVLLSF